MIRAVTARSDPSRTSSIPAMASAVVRLRSASSCRSRARCSFSRLDSSRAATALAMFWMTSSRLSPSMSPRPSSLALRFRSARPSSPASWTRSRADFSAGSSLTSRSSRVTGASSRKWSRMNWDAFSWAAMPSRSSRRCLATSARMDRSPGAPRPRISASSWARSSLLKSMSVSMRRTPSSGVSFPEAMSARTSSRLRPAAPGAVSPCPSQASLNESRRLVVVTASCARGPGTEPFGTRFVALVGFLGSSGSMPSSRIRSSRAFLMVLSKISSAVLPSSTSRPWARAA